MHSRRRSVRFVAGAILLGTVLATVTIITRPNRAEADQFPDPAFTTETVANLPSFTLVGAAFAPDGRLFVWQKNGVVRVVKNGALLPTPFINLSAKVNTFDDRGMWGLTFDPDFANNGFIYLTYMFEDGTNPNDSSEKTAAADPGHGQPRQPGRRAGGQRDRDPGQHRHPTLQRPPADADCIPRTMRQPHHRRSQFAPRRNAALRER